MPHLSVLTGFIVCLAHVCFAYIGSMWLNAHVGLTQACPKYESYLWVSSNPHRLHCHCFLDLCWVWWIGMGLFKTGISMIHLARLFGNLSVSGTYFSMLEDMVSFMTMKFRICTWWELDTMTQNMGDLSVWIHLVSYSRIWSAVLRHHLIILHNAKN